MEELIQKAQKILDLMGFSESKIIIDEEHRKISLIINDNIIQSHTPHLLEAFEHLFNLILRKEEKPNFIIDINYYRRERERLISELAKAAAHKAMVTKADVELPSMNAYERRLVHLEISSHPELKTESIGFGKERHIIIKHLV